MSDLLAVLFFLAGCLGVVAGLLSLEHIVGPIYALLGLILCALATGIYNLKRLREAIRTTAKLPPLRNAAEEVRRIPDGETGYVAFRRVWRKGTDFHVIEDGDWMKVGGSRTLLRHLGYPMGEIKLVSNLP